MSTVIVLSIVVPSVAGAVYLALRGRLSNPAGDTRGIALQTIIILVVLLAIAGAVAAVVLTRAGTETDRLEERDRPVVRNRQQDRLRDSRRHLDNHPRCVRCRRT